MAKLDFPREARSEGVKLFSNIIFSPFFKTKEVVFYISHSIYSHNFYSISIDDFFRKHKFILELYEHFQSF